jgi:hypothetical protein
MLMARLCVLMTALAVHLLGCTTVRADQLQGVILERAAGTFDDASTHRAADASRVRLSGRIENVPGWFDYKIAVTQGGWYEFLLFGRGSEGEYSIRSAVDESRIVFEVTNSSGFDGRRDKLGNVWLPPGDYIVRVANEFWTGSGAITGFALRLSSGRMGERLSVTGSTQRRIMRRNSCEPILIQHGPSSTATSLGYEQRSAVGNALIHRSAIDVPASDIVSVLEWIPPCDAPGSFSLAFANQERGISANDLQQYRYQVFDTDAPSRAGSIELRRRLLHTIDLVKVDPDYSDGSSRIVTSSAGTYRESGARGWQAWQVDPKRSGEPSWFAYTIRGLTSQRLYQVEVDYPDDAERTFAIVLREPNQGMYPVAGGVDSGGEFPLTNAVQTQTLMVWPRGNEIRALFMPSRDRTPAAASAIRIYEIDGDLPALGQGAQGGRRFIHWYEEGTSFTNMFGAVDRRPASVRKAIERWTESAAHMGISTLMPTVVIYESAMYPSRYNRAFSRYSGVGDMLRQILLAAEKRGLEVVPEVHPRADELLFPFQHVEGPKPNQLVSRHGETMKNLPTFYSPLHPHNQDWYIGMIGEIADNYRDSKALKGISLRMMGWKNPTLHNFHSLDWGYDDFSVAAFSRETGVAIPVHGDNDSRFAERHRWLMANAREAWIEWRCRRITDLITRIRDRIREARADLEVHIPIFPVTTIGDRFFSGTTWIREAGFDVEALSRIDGVVLINALHMYGRRWDRERTALLRDNLVGPPARALIADSHPNPHFLSTAVYFEALDFVVTPEQLGFPAGSRRTWTSAVLNPSGRSYLERFATHLADTDALSLGDGGNGYTIGQPMLREFLAEFRRLPAVLFKTLSAPGATVVVRELVRQQDHLLYVVNRSSRVAESVIEFSRGATAVRLSTGAPAGLRARKMTVSLRPFELITYRIAGDGVKMHVHAAPERQWSMHPLQDTLTIRREHRAR